MPMAGGTSARKVGSSFLILSTTSMVLVPGWRWIASTMPRLSLNHAATLSLCTLSMTLPTSPCRTGEPLRYVTMIFLNAAASYSWPVAWTANMRSLP